jgi:hypothetical protein
MRAESPSYSELGRYLAEFRPLFDHLDEIGGPSRFRLRTGVCGAIPQSSHACGSRQTDFRHDYDRSYPMVSQLRIWLPRNGNVLCWSCSFHYWMPRCDPSAKMQKVISARSGDSLLFSCRSYWIRVSYSQPRRIKCISLDTSLSARILGWISNPVGRDTSPRLFILCCHHCWSGIGSSICNSKRTHEGAGSLTD